MIETLQTILPFLGASERTKNTHVKNTLFNKGRWGFRYDPAYREGWRRIGEEYRRMRETDPQNFNDSLHSLSPAEQYALLELLSQPVFGYGNNGEMKSQIDPKQVGELYAELILSHFCVPSGTEEVIREAERRKCEFAKNAWRLTIPQTALMFTILKVTPELARSTVMEEVIPYVQNLVCHMGEQTKQNLGDQTISQLENMGICFSGDNLQSPFLITDYFNVVLPE